MSPVVCLTTVASVREAKRIALHLVKKRLAAGINILPVLESGYHWKGRICRERELLLIMKTTRPVSARLKRELMKIHPYDLPEFVVLPILHGSAPYLRWIRSNVR